MTPRGFDRLVAVTVIIGMAVAAWRLFGERDDALVIRGERPYAIREFSDGATVQFSFLMRGEGLHTMWFRLDADRQTTARVHCVFWHGWVDVPAEMRRAFEADVVSDVRPGGTWVRVSVPRERGSAERWYTLEL